MPESFTQVPPNSTGNKMRTRERVVGANTVHEQGVFQGSLPTYYALADNVAFAANKHMISIHNAAGTGVMVSLKKMFLINLALAAVTGVALRQDVKRFSAVHTVGTAITPTTSDSLNPALPAGVTIKTGATLTDGALIFPLTFTNDEGGATQAFPSTMLQAGINWLPEGSEVQEIRLREGEGITIKNITSTTIGSYAYLIVFTIDEL
jgi:hypothetical protein